MGGEQGRFSFLSIFLCSIAGAIEVFMGGRGDGASVNFSRLMYEYDHGSIDFYSISTASNVFVTCFCSAFGVFGVFLVRSAVVVAVPSTKWVVVPQLYILGYILVTWALEL